jgi:apolipoprotein N-acyltransferase
VPLSILLYGKIGQYFSTFILTGAFLPTLPTVSPLHICRPDRWIPALLCGVVIALSGSMFIYLAALGIDSDWLNTLLGLCSLTLLLSSNTKVWFVSGAFFGLFWFWWIGLSFIHYKMIWAIPFVLLTIALVYGGIFGLIAKTAYRLQTFLPSTLYPLPSLIVKSFGLLMLSYIHPLGFDWFKPELMFVESWLGIDKWHFALILAVLSISLWKRTLLALPMLLLAWQPVAAIKISPPNNIVLVTTHTSIEEKWNRDLYTQQFNRLLHSIDRAIDANASLVVLPETVFPVYLNRTPSLMRALKARAKQINIVAGALYRDGQTPRNSTYIFTKDGKLRIANKVVLVPFGEANPLPGFLSDWVNKVFYDNAVDYKADTNITDYAIDGVPYRNAICFEATSEKLYVGRPKNMIVLSNNGWFTPSIEPVLQRLLLQYYSRKYSTRILHAVNMSPSYIIEYGKVIYP